VYEKEKKGEKERAVKTGITLGNIEKKAKKTKE
jgi:hypothetical protein